MKGLIAGVDEAGRGPLAGPVVAAAVVFANGQQIPEVYDSKRMSIKSREKASILVRRWALDWSIGAATSREIDKINIHHASLLAMRRAVLGLRQDIDYIYVDGKFFPNIPIPGEAVVRGDELMPIISAASIIAKVVRDQQMEYLDRLYSGYGFANHKGYPTSFHRAALLRLGPTSEHRMSYAAVKSATITDRQSPSLLGP